VIPDSTSERGEEPIGLAGPSVPSATAGGWQQVCSCRYQWDPVLLNRNRNFLPCGTGTVKSWNRFRNLSKMVSQKLSQTHSIKLCI
jgi:hypothetical protein